MGHGLAAPISGLSLWLSAMFGNARSSGERDQASLGALEYRGPGGGFGGVDDMRRHDDIEFGLRLRSRTIVKQAAGEGDASQPGHRGVLPKIAVLRKPADDEGLAIADGGGGGRLSLTDRRVAL